MIRFEYVIGIPTEKAIFVSKIKFCFALRWFSPQRVRQPVLQVPLLMRVSSNLWAMMFELFLTYDLTNYRFNISHFSRVRFFRSRLTFRIYIKKRISQIRARFLRANPEESLAMAWSFSLFFVLRFLHYPAGDRFEIHPTGKGGALPNPFGK